AAGAVDLVASCAAIVNDPVLSRRIFALYATIQFIQTANGQRGPAEIALKGTALPTDAYLNLTRGYHLNNTFNKLFHDYGVPSVVTTWDNFDRANGRELEELRKLALANTGRPGTEEQVKHWLEIGDKMAVAMRDDMLVATMNTVSAENDQMLSSARFDMYAYLVVTLAVLAVVVLLGRKVLGILRELLGELAGAMDHMRDGNYDV